MPKNYNIPVEEPGDRVSGYCTTAVVNRRFVAPSADIPGGPTGTENVRIALCGAGAKALGVSDSDGAQFETIGVHCGHFFDLVECGAAVTAGQEVMSDGTGRAITHVPGTATNRANGLALSTTANAGEFVLVKLYS